MVSFTTTILKFAQQGEKTGWSYIEIPADLAEQLKPGTKKSFRVKGFIDDYRYEGMSLIPMGGGRFIMALNATVRKNIHKGRGAIIQVQMEPDEKPFEIPSWMTTCLEDEPAALAYFNSLPPSHKLYFIRWIDGAKTEPTRVRRIAQAVTAFTRKQNYGQMIREQKSSRDPV